MIPLSTDKFNILALDDHPMVLEGLVSLLTKIPNISCHGITDMGKLTDTLYTDGQFDLLILDLELPNTDGFEVIKDLRKRYGQVAILIYTMHEEQWLLARLAQLDIQGVVSKNKPTNDLVKAVEAIRQGGTYFSETFLEQLKLVQTKNDILNSGSPFSLPEGEMKVLQCLKKGMKTKEISEVLFISENTVGTYRHRLMVRFNVHNVVQLLEAARKYLE